MVRTSNSSVISLQDLDPLYFRDTTEVRREDTYTGSPPHSDTAWYLELPLSSALGTILLTTKWKMAPGLFRPHDHSQHLLPLNLYVLTQPHL